MFCAGELGDLQRVDLFGVGAHRADGRDGVGAAVHGQGRHRQCGKFGTESIPGGIQRPGQRRTVRCDEGQRINLERIEVERVARQPGRIQIQRRVDIEQVGDRRQWCAGDDAGAIARRLLHQPQRGDHRTEGMARRNHGQSWVLLLDEHGQRLGQCRTVGQRAEISTRTGTQTVAELIDGPQVDARGVERKTEAVIDAGVFAETVQEHHGGSRFGGRPVPVVHAGGVGLQEGHAVTVFSRACRARRFAGRPSDRGSRR